MIYEMELKGTK